MSNPYPPPYGSDPYQQPQTGYSQPQGDYSQYQQSGYGQPAYGQTGYGQPVYAQQPVLVAQPQTNNKAVVALILGICCYVVGGTILTGIPAIIVGHMAMREIDASGGTQGGKPLALIGLILGYVAVAGTLIACLFIGIFVLGIFGAAATQH
ncbi:MAG TPA: DUF4190 domain-containing protein [Ktedonobacterales bacterium]|nr:DUF4190 domain-containing protein [Ktedonobacterales bacterium]